MRVEGSSYRQFLKRELARRKASRPGYSLRAYSRDLGLSSSFLSLVLSGRKRLSARSALRLSQALGLDAQNSEILLLQVQSESTRNPAELDHLHRRLQKLQTKAESVPVSADAFETIADWYHSAILEMANLENFHLTERNASIRLGITREESRLALERLVRLGHLVPDGKGGFKRVPGHLLMESQDRSLALGRFFEQMSRRSMRAYFELPRSLRMMGFETFAFDPANLKKAEQLTEAYFLKMRELAEDGRRKSAIYYLGIQLLPMTRTPPSEEPQRGSHARVLP